MTVDEVVAHCLAKPGAQETYPWGEEELVAKVGGKAFAFIGLAPPGPVAVKCGASGEQTAEWRERYPEVISVSRHIGRYGWNRVELDGTVPGDDLRELLDESYARVTAKLPKSRRPAGV